MGSQGEVGGAPLGGEHERSVAADLARRALLASPLVVAVAGLVQGWAGALGAAIGMAVVAANFLMLARLLGAGARAGAQAVAYAGLLGYVVLLVFITILAVALRDVDAVDMPSFVLTVAFAHLGLLFLEIPRVGLTLGAPGLKPRPLSRSKERRA